jgi:hypothetical protein
MMMKLMMLNYIRTMQSYVVEFYFFQLKEFGVQETPVNPPSLASYKWVCEQDQIISEEGVALLLPVMIRIAHKYDINTLKIVHHVLVYLNFITFIASFQHI